MSLAICVGVLAVDDPDPEAVGYHREQFHHVNRVLAENGLPPHVEPEVLPDFPYRGQLISFPYAWTPYLHRAVAFARQAPGEFHPLPEGANPYKDKRVDAELYTFAESHLICHSDTEGYFVPIDFEDIIADKAGELHGRLLGSSQNALADLVRTAPLLGIPLEGRELSDEAAQVIAKEADEAHPYWIERKVWLSMFEAFRLSVQHGCAVVYG
ncbi:MAG: hypothetical protein K8U57_27555 [Planctomycetes bacterium]|nr:hypothetical protein [Planctomycetota bacterium]